VTNIEWTEEDVVRLRALANAGLSSSEIAAYFPNKTRNAIMGKLNRTGIALLSRAANEARGRQNKAPKSSRSKKNRKPARKFAQKIPTNVADAINDLQSVAPLVFIKPKTIMELKNYECRCIIGSVNSKMTKYCAAPTKPNSSYCEDHHRKFYHVTRAKDP